MAIIRLRIFTENNKTHTGFVVKGNDTIEFENDSPGTLRVTVDTVDALLEHGEGKDLIKIEPGQKKSYSIGNGCAHDCKFKYTATIAGSETEDPVIIIDRH